MNLYMVDTIIIGDNMNKKKKNKIFLLLILLLGITVGFAALATTLKINGNAGIGKNSWNIYWDSIGNEDGVTPETATEIVDEDTTHKKNIVTFDVTFDKPGDFYEFQVDAVNAGTIDAEILEIESKYNDAVISQENPLPSYLKYSVKYADGSDITVGDKLAKRTSTTEFTRKRYKIRVEYDKDAVTIDDVNDQDGDVTHSFSFKVEYGQSSTEPTPSAVALATDPWDVIAAEGNSAATQESTNGTCGVYNVGDTKEVDLGDLGVHTVRIANCSTPTVCSDNDFSQTACGFVLEFEDVISTHRINPIEQSANVNGDGTKGGWEYSDMRAYVNSGKYLEGTTNEINYATDGIYDKFPNDLKNKLDDTKVVSGYGMADVQNFTTTDKLYLFSTHEVWNDVDGDSNTGIDKQDTAYSYTRQLDYYIGQSVTTSSYAAAKKYNTAEDTSVTWWLRSTNESYQNFYYVDSDGQPRFNRTRNTYWVSPAFKLK